MSAQADPLARPLFAEDEGQAQRIDAWSFPKGISRDGMIEGATGKRELADQYFDAAEAIVRLVLNNEVPDYTVANPILYLYRHAVELYLKAAIEAQTGRPYRWEKTENGHELDAIIRKAPHLSPEARARILELHAIDPKSTHLRFGARDAGFPGPEGWAELTHLRDAMRALHGHLADMVERVRRAKRREAPS